MKPKYIFIILLLAITNYSHLVFSQEYQHNLTERIYVHTDRPLYFPGETIWFKAYIVDAGNLVTNISDIVYVELLAPNGEIIKTHRLPVTDGYAYGDFTIDTEKPGGLYQIRSYTRWMKNFGEESFFIKNLMVQKIVKPKLLMKLEFEKEAYGKNAEVVAKFELKNLRNDALKNTEIEYILNISGNKFLSEKMQTDAEGKADIKFILPDTLNTSDLILNVLIPYNGNTEAISRSVPVILDNIDLQFLPEGGYSLTGVENTIAFKALNEFGKPADIEAEIIDEKGVVLQHIESYHDGMGAFKFNPEKGKVYYAKIIKPFVSDLRYEIPNSIETGFVFSLVNNDSSEIRFKIFSHREENVILSGQTPNAIILKKKTTLQKGWNEISFEAKLFPVGIVEFTLFDDKNRPQLERLVFANQSKDLKISTKTDKNLYAPREKVEVEITTTDHDGKPIPSNLSIAVVDDKIISFADDKQDNILSYLLMNSFLKGKIEKPNFYFDPKEEKAEKALDLVMLTNGWRSYFADSAIDMNDAKLQPEQTQIETRTVIDNKKEPVKATVLIIEQYNKKNVAKFETDETGTFRFKREPNKDYAIVAYGKNDKDVYLVKDYIPKEKPKQKTKIEEDTKSKTELEKNGKTDETEKEDKKEVKEDKKENKEIKENKEEKDKNEVKEKTDNIKPEKEKTKTISNNREDRKPMRSDSQKTAISSDNITLESDAVSVDEVVVIGYGTTKKSDVTGSVVSVHAEEILALENINNSLQGRVAGIAVKNIDPGSSGNIKVRGTSSLSSNNEPLYVIDGMTVNQLPGNDILSSLVPEDITSIEVLRDNTATSIYGARASSGVIVINTKNNNIYNAKLFLPGNVKRIAIENIYYYLKEVFPEPKMFYTPRYDNKQPVKTRNDFRQTIYWNPVVQTDSSGKAKISFYNSDAITSYRVISEGIGYNGLPGRNEQTYAIQKPLSIDVKVPAYLSVGDTLKIPVIVTNNTTEELLAKLSLILPKEMKLVSPFEDNLIISGQQGKTQSIEVVPVNEIPAANLYIGVKSEGLEDMFKQDVAIISPLFPKKLSFSGNKNETFSFSLNDQIEPGSLTAGFTLYLDIIGDVMNGIESILGEPHGCFEQVSSTAYPNVLVMKYLRESGKLKPEIEKKAMEFIESGYKQLAAYETSMRGFEWYGGTPPHEVLSAYGIMQFLEMKDIYDGVNEKMIHRTIEWLMTRKDNKGGFMQNNGRYGFSGAPKNVNNAYLVYALSSPGVNAPIEEEYQSTLDEALKTKDLYRLSLLAIASHNMKKYENYSKIVDMIIDKVKWNDLNTLMADNSITYSYGNSLKVETASFIALALMKDTQYTAYVSQLTDFILKNREYGYFGNTQATTMALKALIEYTRQYKNKLLLSKDKPFIIKLNGNEIKAQLEQNEQGLIQISGLEKYLKNGQQKIEILFPDSSISIPYSVDINWKSKLPASSTHCPLGFKTALAQKQARTGETVRMNIEVKNQSDQGLPMSIAIVGIPSGLSVQMWQLKELKEKQQFDYFEIINNFVVFYWRELGPNEIKSINLDLKAELKGNYTAAASSAYLYYANENKRWLEGTRIEVE